MKLDRKLFVQSAAVLLAVPLVYFLSMGPVLYFTFRCEKWAHPGLHGRAPLFGGSTYWRVYDFYRPLRRAAYAISLGPALSSYLSLWHLPIIRVAGKTGTAQAPRANSPATPTPSPQAP